MTPTEIATVLKAHELHALQSVKPFQTMWVCECGHSVAADLARHSDAQAKHQAQKVAVALRREARGGRPIVHRRARRKA